MKRLIPLLILFAACTKEDDYIPQKEYSFTIDSVLTRDGKQSLLLDANGNYHLKLFGNLLPKSTSQQTHRVTGRILVNGKEPYPAEKIGWESNLFWYIQKGDTIAKITKSYINYYTGQFTIVSLPPLISSMDELVPTTNTSSYSGRNGEINTMIAPIKNMIGDTLILKATHYESKKVIYTKIVLE
jgi:hypothetical protein